MEGALYEANSVGSITIGDFNIHHRKWLRFSSKNTEEGEVLQQFCFQNNLRQHVTQPTRSDHLLDLVVSDLEPAPKTEIYSKIADHQSVLSRFFFPTPTSKPISRVVWDIKRADWGALLNDFDEIDWRIALPLDANSVAKALESTILSAMHRHIPRTRITEQKSTHPWLNDTCRKAFAEKATTQ